MSPISRADLKVLHEDESLLVIDKPSGMAVHPARGMSKEEQTLVDVVGEGFEPLHRLDRGTSGVLVFCSDPKRRSLLQGGWEQMKKTYWAKVGPGFEQALGAQEGVLKKKLRNRKGILQSAQTQWKVLRDSSEETLLELKPITGRKHQLRRHLKAAGFPIVGDEKYGGLSSDRMYLHCVELEGLGICAHCPIDW